MTAPSLIERLEGAERGSRELDAEICDLLLEPIIRPLSGTRVARWPFAEGSGVADKTPPVTTSLDAALALAERVLPGKWITSIDQWPTRTMVEAGEGRPHWGITDWRTLFTEYEAPCRQVKGVAKSPALATCIAILRARKDTQ